jgi:hypothetical protein
MQVEREVLMDGEGALTLAFAGGDGENGGSEARWVVGFIAGGERTGVLTRLLGRLRHACRVLQTWVRVDRTVHLACCWTPLVSQRCYRRGTIPRQIYDEHR